jgi:hypothetical protein
MKEVKSYNGPFPIIELEGTQFYVNGYLNELVQVDNPDNRIDMFDMIHLEDHVELWYDPETKNVYDGLHNGAIPGHVKLFWFYPFSAMDPLGTNARLDESDPGWRKNFPTDLPIVNISGKDFFVDEKCKAFRDIENCWNMISFADVIKHNGKTGIYIDTRVVQVPFPHEFDSYHPPDVLPEHIVFAEVPDGQHLAFLLHEYNNQKQQQKDNDQNDQRRIRR